MTSKFGRFLALSALAVTSALAADVSSLHISVPFAFRAGKIMLPPGQYVVTEAESGVILIKGDRGSAIMMASVVPGTSSTKASMSFSHSAQGYSLTTVNGLSKSASGPLPAQALSAR